jgi:cytochrome c
MAFARPTRVVLRSSSAMNCARGSRLVAWRGGRPSNATRRAVAGGARLAVACLLAASLAACRAPEDPRRPPPGGDASRGPALMQHYGCAACHTIPGVAGAEGRVGPPLWAMGDRAYIAGVLPNTEQDMVRWILDPRQANPLTAMPQTGVSEEEARDIAAYLAGLSAEPLAMRMLRGYIERAIGREVGGPRMPGPDGGGE